MNIKEQLRLFEERSIHATADDIPLAIRQSRRARRLILRLVPPSTLEVVVPLRARPAEVEAFVTQNRRWIERARSEIARRCATDRNELPARIELKAIGRAWNVRYRELAGTRAARRASGSNIEIVTPDKERRDAPPLLRAWLIAQGRTYLGPWLQREAERVGRSPCRVQIRLQRTRWGSCSATGVISLSAGLLFLDPSLVRYLLVHELCHLEAMNHSRRFWRLVQRFEPDSERLDRELAESWTDVPWWAHRVRSNGV